MIRCVLSWCILVMSVQGLGYLVTTPVEFG